MPPEVPEPWLSFLRDVDGALSRPIEIHCLGGFVLRVLWGLPRLTGDVDFIEVRPSEGADELLRIAGSGSALAHRYGLHFQKVTVAEYPEGYESRLIDITPKAFLRLRIKAFEVHDLVLAKLTRNSPRDRADLEFLAGKAALDRQVLQDRFNVEVRPYLLNEARESLTLQLWLDEFLGKRKQ